jgi:hypothetical protein
MADDEKEEVKDLKGTSKEQSKDLDKVNDLLAVEKELDTARAKTVRFY